VNQCISTLSAKPFGTFDEAWGDNVVCRSVHVILAQVNPDTHCKSAFYTCVPGYPFSKTALGEEFGLC